MGVEVLLTEQSTVSTRERGREGREFLGELTEYSTVSLRQKEMEREERKIQSV